MFADVTVDVISLFVLEHIIAQQQGQFINWTYALNWGFAFIFGGDLLKIVFNVNCPQLCLTIDLTAMVGWIDSKSDKFAFVWI